MLRKYRWLLIGAVIASSAVATTAYTYAQANTPQVEAVAIAEKVYPLAFQDASGPPTVFSTTAGDLRQQLISVPSQLPNSSGLWVVELNGLKIASAGPIGSPTKYHHALDILVDVASGQVVEAYSNH